MQGGLCPDPAHPVMSESMQVIVFDPQYDAYIPLCVAQGGVPKAVKLNTEDWSVPHAGKASGLLVQFCLGPRLWGGVSK